MRFDLQILWPPLHITAFFNFADIVEQELKHKVLVNLQNNLKFTLLLQAIHGDNPEAALVLIDHKAYVQTKTSYGYTAMRYACCNSLSTLLLLLKASGQADQLDYNFG
jgi:ankyrin repeat protein